MQFKKLVALSAFLIAAAPAPAADLTLERVFGSPSLSGPSPRLPKLSPDGRLATLLRNRADDKDATTCGRSTPPRARRGCWSIR
jgi:dipeptidyl-peptidase-4